MEDDALRFLLQLFPVNSLFPFPPIELVVAPKTTIRFRRKLDGRHDDDRAFSAVLEQGPNVEVYFRSRVVSRDHLELMVDQQGQVWTRTLDGDPPGQLLIWRP
jgi:hypothetical protein